MPKLTKLRLHLLKLFRENYWLLFSGHGVNLSINIGVGLSSIWAWQLHMVLLFTRIFLDIIKSQKLDESELDFVSKYKITIELQLVHRALFTTGTDLHCPILLKGLKVIPACDRHVLICLFRHFCCIYRL